MDEFFASSSGSLCNFIFFKARAKRVKCTMYVKCSAIAVTLVMLGTTENMCHSSSIESLAWSVVVFVRIFLYCT